MNGVAMKNSGRLAQVDFDYGQSRIAAEVAACDVDFHFGPIARADRNGFGQLPVGECFVRRPHAQCTVGTLCVVPCRKRVEPSLNAAGRRRHGRQPLALPIAIPAITRIGS